MTLRTVRAALTIQRMQRGSRLSEDEMAGVISGAAQLYRREQGVKVVEVSIRVSSKENEANICGDLGGQAHIPFLFLSASIAS